MELIFVSLLFITYLLLWEIKRRRQIKSTGADPKVLFSSKSPIQKYFAAMTSILTIYVVLIIIAHGAGVQWHSLFTRFPLMNSLVYDIIGFALGIGGLAMCLIAQNTMKNSWRVGVDENAKTELVTSGIYRYIRNPTYAGMFLMNFGVWLIWPTWTIALFALAFYLIMEMQVRFEEVFLENMHGDAYRNYIKTAKRYIPRIY